MYLHNLTPCRALDTRNPPGPQPFATGLVADLGNSNCGVPVTAQAYVANATAVPVGVLGFPGLWPDGQNQPVVSTVNSLDASVTSYAAIVPTVDGSVNVYASNPTQLILDLSGYFAP